MTEHHSGVNTDSLKKQKSGEPRGASLYNDTPFRAEFLMLAAMGSMEEEAGWDFMMKEVFLDQVQENIYQTLSQLFQRLQRQVLEFVQTKIKNKNHHQAM